MRATRSIVVLFALLLAGCGGGAETGGSDKASPATEETAAEPAGPGDDCVETSEISAVGSEWEPLCAVSSDGSLTIVNEDPIPHTFTITGTDIDVDLAKDATETADVTGAVEPGVETEYYCEIHPSMIGYLWVQ